ncbi:glycoside hydrolase family 17 protein [Sphaerobolus stellatus SS14]|uniref:Glycoside hydrolase family 17 protein n=1 Tax=Sphaerobolus stellatus (strain SS14) TaxID=990650 RepID=A0A0C9T4L8_SPHS4|nr:glycoside hydrolase family 17 protein [Sphaerobolus stellatus SS14]
MKSNKPCFPSHIFNTPTLSANETAPSAPLNEWCDMNDEQGFMGFSYYVEVCMNSTYLLRDFTRTRTEFNARYVRSYSWCDDATHFSNNVIGAAYEAGVGVYAAVWFGLSRSLLLYYIIIKDTHIYIIQTNPLAPYVVRSIDVGSEPLFDGDLPADQLAQQIVYMQQNVHPFGIGVSISEMEYGFTSTNGSQAILDVVDFVHAGEYEYFLWHLSVIFPRCSISFPIFDFTGDISFTSLIYVCANGKGLILSFFPPRHPLPLFLAVTF